jgi:predicted nucleic acid-binding protein
MVVECAVVSSATHIVTGDKHLLALAKYRDIKIIKATEFVALLSQS